MRARTRLYKRVWVRVGGVKLSMYRLVRDSEVDAAKLLGARDVSMVFDKLIEYHSVLVEALRREARSGREEADIVELIVEDEKHNKKIIIGEITGRRDGCVQVTPRPVEVERLALLPLPSSKPETLSLRDAGWVKPGERIYAFDACVEGLEKPSLLLLETPEGLQAAIIEPSRRGGAGRG